MSIPEIREILNKCERSEVHDRYYGDSEITWHLDGLLVAEAYVSRYKRYVHFYGTRGRYWPHRFEGHQAEQLHRCGIPVRFQHVA